MNVYHRTFECIGNECEAQKGEQHVYMPMQYTAILMANYLHKKSVVFVFLLKTLVRTVLMHMCVNVTSYRDDLPYGS